MTQMNNIGILGHYGNQNLGDEAIIEAMIANIKKKNSDAVISCFSINPMDSAQRYQVECFPIRFREDFFNQDAGKNNKSPEENAVTSESEDVKNASDGQQSSGLKQRIKKIPVIGTVARAVVSAPQFVSQVKTEIFFLRKAKKQLASMDLLIVCGSNQFLDNFGGAWGFPYTLLKWTILAKLSGSKVAFVSIGAGPLVRTLSYLMLKVALGKADYLSYRDKGSKQLVESRLKNIDGKIYPDIAHSLPYQSTNSDADKKERDKVVGINPMPVYDRRYWFESNDEKYNWYVLQMADLCSRLVKEGYRVKLFGTQISDGDVIVDIVNLLENGELKISSEQIDRIETVMDETVSELMHTIDSCDVIFATRFHATVLPLKLNKPVIGICYYRKASELLDEVGLTDFHVQIDDFTSDELFAKFTELMRNESVARKSIAATYSSYEDELEEQYEALFNLA